MIIKIYNNIKIIKKKKKKKNKIKFVNNLNIIY